jgi:hypothetical protein
LPFFLSYSMHYFLYVYYDFFLTEMNMSMSEYTFLLGFPFFITIGFWPMTLKQFGTWSQINVYVTFLICEWIGHLLFTIGVFAKSLVKFFFFFSIFVFVLLVYNVPTRIFSRHRRTPQAEILLYLILFSTEN